MKFQDFKNIYITNPNWPLSNRCRKIAHLKTNIIFTNKGLIQIEIPHRQKLHTWQKEIQSQMKKKFQTKSTHLIIKFTSINWKPHNSTDNETSVQNSYEHNFLARYYTTHNTLSLYLFFKYSTTNCSLVESRKSNSKHRRGEDHWPPAVGVHVQVRLAQDGHLIAERRLGRRGGCGGGGGALVDLGDLFAHDGARRVARLFGQRLLVGENCGALRASAVAQVAHAAVNACHQQALVVRLFRLVEVVVCERIVGYARENETDYD